MLNKDTLIELMEKVRDIGIRELIITHDRVEIRAGDAPASSGGTLPPKPAAQPAQPPAPPPAAPADAPAEKLVAVTAPIPGMVFVYPGQDLHKKPLPGPGAAVKEGDVIALVEAMKMFNEIYAPAAGVIERMTAGNKTMVKVGEVIMQIRVK